MNSMIDHEIKKTFATSPFFFIDTHAHLDYEYPFSTEDYLKNAAEFGIKKFFTISAEPDSLARTQALAEKYENVYFSTGIHPHDTKEYSDEIESKILSQATEHPKCIAVGEIGLDYYYENTDRELQQKVLDRQLNLAIKTQKPVIIHSRDAEEDLFQQLKNFASNNPHRQNKQGVIHCFSGSEKFAFDCIDLGFYISFSGILTFKNAGDLREICKKIPKNRLIIETDAPFLAPVPYRGKKNQSAFMIETAKVMAELHQITLEELAKITTANTQELFQSS
jgi:TatD DNase family protein